MVWGMFDKAMEIAVRAHANQKDRYGKPYILHPIRVMMKVASELEKTVALLHDIVEDSPWTLDDLIQEGFPEEVVHAVECLTKRENEPYFDYIERVLKDPLSIRVKIADLEDNMELRRITKLSEKDQDRLERYHRAWNLLIRGST